jgi:signal transduction histidine kinase
MRARSRRPIIVLLATIAAFAGCAVGIDARLAQSRAAFETDARIIHRLLSQRVSQHDAIMAMLVLMQGDAPLAGALERLPSVYPQIVSARATFRNSDWDDAGLNAAETESRATRRPVIATSSAAPAHYTLLQSTAGGSIALRIDIATMVPWSEWPLSQQAQTPTRVTLQLYGRTVVLQPGTETSPLGRFTFAKPLASESQPFEVALSHPFDWSDLPWIALGAWITVVAVGAALLLALDRQSERRRRAEELLRVGQVARLDTLGELAAGMAHELNQPLAALCAGTQAARRLIDEDPPDLPTARTAMGQAVDQARRAADVLARLRRLVERPGDVAQHRLLDLAECARQVITLLEPELERHGIRTQVETGDGTTVMVKADAVGLEQIVHNLVMNAVQALADTPRSQRAVKLTVTRAAHAGVLTVADTGPGIAPDALPRLFEPFYSGRSGGLGLGLTLCETLAQGMNATLTARNGESGGALFELRIPLAEAS